MSEEEPTPGDPDSAAVSPDPADPADPTEPPEPHADDGLDLARSLTKAAASGGTPARARRRRRPPGAGQSARGRVSGAHPDDRDPQLLGGELDRLVGERGWELDLRVRGIFARWAELVGPEVGEHCTPESLVDGRLVVRAHSTAWATQLKLLTPTLVRRLNEQLGHGTVIVIEILGPHLPHWRKGPRSSRDGRGPRDTYG